MPAKAGCAANAARRPTASRIRRRSRGSESIFSSTCGLASGSADVTVTSPREERIVEPRGHGARRVGCIAVRQIPMIEADEDHVSRTGTSEVGGVRDTAIGMPLFRIGAGVAQA